MTRIPRHPHRPEDAKRLLSPEKQVENLIYLLTAITIAAGGRVDVTPEQMQQALDWDEHLEIELGAGCTLKLPPWWPPIPADCPGNTTSEPSEA